MTTLIVPIIIALPLVGYGVDITVFRRERVRRGRGPLAAPRGDAG